MEMETDSSDEDSLIINTITLNEYRDIAEYTKTYLNDTIARKGKVSEQFKITLNTQIDRAVIIYHGIDEDDEFKYVFGVVLDTMRTQCFILERYGYKRPRMPNTEKTKVDAYSDPQIASNAEMTTGGLKTRNRFYKRL
jgi:hypothetical protein